MTFQVDLSNRNRRRSRSGSAKTPREGLRRSARLSGVDLETAVHSLPSVGVRGQRAPPEPPKAKKRKTMAISFTGRNPKRHRTTDSSLSFNESGCSSLLVELSKRPPALSSGDRNIESIRQSTGAQENNHSMVCQPFDATKYTIGISVYDSSSVDDVLQAPDYASDIFHRLFHEEEHTCPFPYMDGQPDLNPTMRMILVDWLIEVHTKFKLEHATLYLAVNILDRYMSGALVTRCKLQLVGVTALLLACKYEEIYPPLINDCTDVTDRAFSPKEVLDTESQMLFALRFQLSIPTAYPFLQRFLFILKAKPTMGIAAHYYMDRVLLEHGMLELRPSVIAAAAVCLAINHPGVRWHDKVDGQGPGIVSQTFPDFFLHLFAVFFSMAAHIFLVVCCPAGCPFAIHRFFEAAN
jgi:hypothetical protein